MKITGAAPKIAVPTFLYLFVMVVIDNLSSHYFKITFSHYLILLIIALIFIAVGIVGVVVSGRKILKAFNSSQLMTDGLYSVVRNPMYASYLVFVIPGICLIFNSWLVLTTVIFNFIILQIFIKEEYKYLDEKFGDEYKKYLDKVWIKFL